MNTKPIPIHPFHREQLEILLKHMESMPEEVATKKKPDGYHNFDLEWYAHQCGAPACLLGQTVVTHPNDWRIHDTSLQTRRTTRFGLTVRWDYVDMKSAAQRWFGTYHPLFSKRTYINSGERSTLTDREIAIFRLKLYLKRGIQSDAPLDLQQAVRS